MKNPFACFFRSVLERIGRPRRIPAEPPLSRERFRELLVETLDDPATVRLLARRLLLPTLPIAGASDYPVTTPGGNAGYLPMFDDTAEIVNSAAFEDAATGKVGIGTATPASKLSVQDTNTIAGEVGHLRLADATTPAKRLAMGFDVTGGIDAGWIRAFHGGVGYKDLLLQYPGGNVGIGKAAPSEVLDVAGNVRFSGALMPNNAPGSAGQVLISAGAGSPPTWAADLVVASEKVTIRPGTTGYVEIRNIAGAAEGGTIRLRDNAGTSFFLEAYNANGTLRGVNSAWTATLFTIDQSGNLVMAGTGTFGTNAVISGSGDSYLKGGKLGIGTDTPVVPLHVAGVGANFHASATASGGLAIRPGLVGSESTIISCNDGDDLAVGAGRNLILRTYSSGWQDRVTILDDGNVGIGTTDPQAKLHVKGGGIAIEDVGGAGKLKFRESIGSTTRTEIYRDAADFCVVRNREQQDYTIVKIWAPPESSFPTTPREATLALVRALDDETKTEFLDLYNNYYSTEKQYGIRIAKKGSGTSFHDFVFDQYDQDQDKKTPVMILKVDGKVGVGTDVPGARLEAADPSVLAGENLTNGALTSGTSWSRTGDMSLAADKATYTHNTGAGTLTQASGDFAIAAKPYRLYLFTYTVSGVSGTAPAASISTAFAAEARPLNTKDEGTHSVMLHAAASPGDFVISVTSSAAGSFTIDSLSLKEVTGGDIIADGLFTGAGPSGIKVDNAGNVGIGTATPSNILTVVQGSSTDPIADAWSTYSSRRYKTNIRPLQAALEKVERLRGVSYERKGDGKRQIGVVGEEVGEVVPKIVGYEENGRDAKSVDYARLTALLIEAIKEQQGQLRELRRQVEARNAGAADGKGSTKSHGEGI
jgi:hypothetical protein